MSFNEKWNEIQRAIEDAERMISYASKGKTYENADLTCLEELAKATLKLKKTPTVEDIDEEDIANFFRQLSLMSHILYPVGSESLRMMAGMSLQPCAPEKKKGLPCACVTHLRNIACFAPMLIILPIFALIVGLLITPYVFTLSLEGSSIISRLDVALKERSTLKSDLIEEARKYKPKSNSEVPYKAIQLVRQIELKTMMLNGLVGQLKAWNKSMIGRIIAPQDPADKPDASKPETSGNDARQKTWDLLGSLPEKGASDFYTELFHKQIATLPSRHAMEKSLKIKNNGLLILQTLNNCILLLLFGCCGASAYILRKTVQEIQSHTFTGIGWTAWIRVLLGTFSGLFLGYLAGSNELLNLMSLGSDPAETTPVNISIVSPLTLAFVGGYSVELLFNIMNRFIYALTNDERYLPAAELMKRKADVSKFILKKEPSQPAGPSPHVSHDG